MLSACAILFHHKKNAVPTLIHLRIPSKGTLDQCVLLSEYLLYHTKLLSTAKTERAELKKTDVDGTNVSRLI
jgi:hypothetical protein